MGAVGRPLDKYSTTWRDEKQPGSSLAGLLRGLPGGECASIMRVSTARSHLGTRGV